MEKYRVLTPVKTSDGTIHKVNETIELSDQEAAGCLSFKAVVPVIETSQPVQPDAVTPILQKNEEQVKPETSQKMAAVEDNIVPPEGDVR